MKRSLLITFVLLLLCVFTLSSCVGDFDLPSSLLDRLKEELSADVEDITEATKPAQRPSYKDEEIEEDDEEDEDVIYSATEIYNQSVKYVGEIITYDSRGNASTLGTGFVISSDGEVLTNYHVIEGAYSADITINNKKYEVSTVLAYDEDIDLAVLKIEADKLPHATLCKHSVNAGETIYAIGSSRGLTNTYSQGIVTYGNRIINGVSYVQHDASITHGNSGGPLINVYGEVIGVNTWGVDDSQNLNFAVYIGELDNLEYRTPFTLAELYEQSHVAFDALMNFIIDNGQADEDGVELYIENSLSEITALKYYYEDDEILLSTFVVNSNGSTFFAGIFLEREFTDCFYACYRRVNGELTNELTGYIDGNTFTRDTLVEYENYEGSAYLEQAMQSAASELVVYLVDILQDVSVEYLDLSAADYGFVAFVNS